MSQIKIIFGKRGTGKTALNTKFVLDEIAEFQRYQQSLEQIEYLKSFGVDIGSPPLKHVVFTNYKCKDKFNVETYPLNPFHMTMPNDDGFEFDIYYPNSAFHVMEGQTYWNSRRQINIFSSSFFENSRQNGLDIIIDTQRPKLIDQNIRDITDVFITILELIHEYNNQGRILSSTWECLEFEDFDIVEEYLRTKNINLGTKTTYTFKGCIFDYYNTNDNMLAYYRSKNKPIICNWCDVDKFITPPKNYYMKK